MPSKRQLARENEGLRTELNGIRELLTFSMKTAEMGVLALAERIPPTREDMETLASELPQWSISCETVEDGFNDKSRKIVKRFTRYMGDMRPELEGDIEIYKRFYDGETFDDGLRKALSLGDESLGYISGRGENGRYPSITMEVDGEESITKLDLIRIKAAEQYLESQNLLGEAVAA